MPTGFNMHMGMTAENVCTNETYQKKYGYNPITREQLDEFCLQHSQEKAAKAIADGAFKDEIVPVVIKGKKGDTVFDTDEGPRMSSMEVLAKLKPCFKKDGIVTAANSSAINDGAAALVVMSEEKAKELGVEPLATWVAGALAGVEPEVMGLGPIAATKKVMAKTGLTVDDMDLIEANEAFAAQSVAVGEALNFDQEQAERQRRRYRSGPSRRRFRRSYPGHPAVRHEASRRSQGPGYPVHRRRHGLRHHR